MNNLEQDLEYLEIRKDYVNTREWFFIKARLHNIDNRTLRAYQKASDRYMNYIEQKLGMKDE